MLLRRAVVVHAIRLVLGEWLFSLAATKGCACCYCSCTGGMVIVYCCYEGLCSVHAAVLVLGDGYFLLPTGRAVPESCYSSCVGGMVILSCCYERLCFVHAIGVLLGSRGISHGSYERLCLIHAIDPVLKGGYFLTAAAKSRVLVSCQWLLY